MKIGKKAVPLRRVPLGSEFWICGSRRVLNSWHVSGATVSDTGAAKLVSITDRYGNEREFVARSQKSTRIASCIVVEVDADARLLGLHAQHGMDDSVTAAEWGRALRLDERMRSGSLVVGE